MILDIDALCFHVFLEIETSYYFFSEKNLLIIAQQLRINK